MSQSTPGLLAPYTFERLAGENATRHAEDVLSAAWAEAEEVRAAAYTEGHAAGHAAGRADFEVQCTPALAALGAAASALDGLADEVVTVLERQAATVAMAVAEHVLGAALAVEPALVVGICRGALRRLAERQHVTAVVNSEDLELLSRHVDALVAELGGIERFEVQADRRVARGGCVVRTSYGEIDATLDTQLARAREIIMAALRPDPARDGEPAPAECDGVLVPDPATDADA